MHRILIASPDTANRKALALLISHKFDLSSVAEAGDVETLIRSLSDQAYDLVLLDWRLYGAPALETCRLLLKAFPDLKVVLLSVNADDAEATLASGAAFIHQGASPEHMIATLEALLKDSG